MLCVDARLPSRIVSILPNLETIIVVISGDTEFNVCLSYLPPNATKDTIEGLYTVIGDMAKASNAIILGDFNCPDVDWVSLTADTSKTSIFCDLLYDNNLTQLVLSPTHKGGNTLDLIITNSEGLISSIKVEEANNYSDHFMINFAVCDNVHLPKCSKFSIVHDYTNADFEGMCSFLLDHDFSDFIKSNNIDDLWFYLKHLLMEAVDMFLPKARVSNSSSPKWFTPDIRHSINRLRYRRRKLMKNPSRQAQAAIVDEEQHISKMIEAARALWERKLVDDFAGSSNHKIYSHIRSLSRLVSFPTPMTLGSQEAPSAASKAELFNKYFHSVLSRSSDFPLRSISDFDGTASDIRLDPMETLRALESLDQSKAMGSDAISPKVLKHCALAIFGPVTHLFQLSLNQGYLPLEWKSHLITPVFKSGDRSLVNNYRPISLLCIISKVLERLIYNHIIDYLSTEVLNSVQFGFRRGKSTIQQLLLFFEDISNAANKHQQVDAVYLDFRKAFDSVPHVKLLQKLRACGITGQLWYWFHAYLSNRQQATVIERHVSGYLPVTSGVPQGSILGPILFILFLNDLPSVVSAAKILKFADDTKCYKTVSDGIDAALLQEDIDNIGDWSKANDLGFNPNKLALIHFHRRHSIMDTSYCMHGSEIASRDSHRDLGILVSDDLSWSCHHKSILAKAYGKLAMIRRTFSNLCPINSRKKLYISLIRSQLVYGSQLWRPMHIKDIRKLEQMQRRATKFILGDWQNDYKSRLLKLEILPLMMLYELNDIMFFITNMRSPSESYDILQHVAFSSSNTRSCSSKLIHRRPVTNFHRHFYYQRLVKLWNALPTIDLTLSTNNLRRKVKNFLWSVFVNKFNSDNACTFHFVCPCNNCSSTPRPPNFSTF